MKSPIHILHLEDDPKDASLIEKTLAAESIPCAITRVQNRDGFVAALERGGIDLILSDGKLPTFDGMSALEVAHAKWPAIPFILVSGTMGEQRAIDSLKNGATDYVLKERMATLAPAVRRAVQEGEERAANRRTEEALQESEQRLRIIFHESSLGIALVGVDGHPVLTNPAFQRMLGYTGQELNRMAFLEFSHPEDRAEDLKLYQQLMQGARKSYQIEKRYIRKDGSAVWARLSMSLARDAAGDADFAIGIVEDMTERRNMEAQFIEAQKMQVIGQLAGGVAHDFNNLLAVIMGYSDLMLLKFPDQEEIRTPLETIRSTAERAAGLTRQLLIFSRNQTVQPVVLDLNVVMEGLKKMLPRLIDENIEMKIVLGKAIGRVEADSGYVGQVVMNLVINARDAMPNGGNITLSTSNSTLDENYARAHPGVVPGDYVMLSVSDTGTGMTDEVKAHLFEAFFTTKPKGKGTGLGLATCQTIVQQSGGHIGLESEVGQGTTFKVYFPQVHLPLETAANPVQAGPLPRGTETLLVVEDEPAVRKLARGVLEGQGYEVLSASNGQDALHAVRDHTGSPIRLVVTDVVMPQMGGNVMAEWLKTTNPGLKILFTSGYMDDTITRHGVLESGVEFLPKPYTLGALVVKVREMLDTSH